MRIVIDTSGLLSLAAGNILELATKFFDFIIPTRVKQEIDGIAKNNNFETKLAKNVLFYINNEIKIIDAYKISQQGELECAYLANELDDVEFLITDDIKILEKLGKISKKEVNFSTLIVYSLYLSGKISKEQGWKAIERMGVKRNWKNNIIFDQAKLLWNSL